MFQNVLHKEIIRSCCAQNYRRQQDVLFLASIIEDYQAGDINGNHSVMEILMLANTKIFSRAMVVYPLLLVLAYDQHVLMTTHYEYFRKIIGF
ncbi:hypothetical protein GQX74_009632 [Glossina fuscipes]|nr:hypothetical protein GQX74_009632 [Glossina fuscipes]